MGINAGGAAARAVGFQTRSRRIRRSVHRYEADLYSRCSSKPHRQAMLCPVLWCSPSGKLQIARRAATPITQEQLDGLILNQRACNEWDHLWTGDDDCPFEWKPTDWGMLDGRLVAVDYAATCPED
jgi:hypothetical protein